MTSLPMVFDHIPSWLNCEITSVTCGKLRDYVGHVCECRGHKSLMRLSPDPLPSIEGGVRQRQTKLRQQCIAHGVQKSCVVNQTGVKSWRT